MRLAILLGIIVALLLGGDALLNNGHGARAIQRSITGTIASLLD